jgi:hypothetical protein
MAGAAGGAALIGAGMEWASTTFGKGGKPNIPDYTPIDITQSQVGTIRGNLTASQDAEQLATRTNVFNQDQILKMLKAAIPGYDAMMEKGGSNINSMLRGELPSDVSSAVWNSAAARATAGGYGGSGAGRNLGLRDLGMTSLDITTRGLDAASRWISMAKATATPELFSSANMFLTPAQRLSVDVAENQKSWDVQLMKEQVKAMPEPRDAAMSGLLAEQGGQLRGLGMQGMMGGGSSTGSTGGGMASWSTRDWNAWNTNRALDWAGY